MIVDGFAGPGGWSEGIRRYLGLHDVGLEWDTAACRTRAAAGHLTVQCDITQYPAEPFVGRARAQIWSPVCTPFSQGGKHAGLTDMHLAHQAVDDLARGRDTRAGLRSQCQDIRSLLVAEPMRFLHAERSEWVVMEQVPPVLPIWRQYAQHLRGWGYSVWCGVLNAADFGVPQSRKRAILIASHARKITAPKPTHTERSTGDDLFGCSLPDWVSMATALGWGYTTRPAPTVTGGGTDSGGAEPWSSTSRRAMRDAMADPNHWAWRRPAPTISGTVGHVGGKQAHGHLNLEPEEGAVLQSFRRDYPFHGNKGQRSLQIGNAIPPLFAAHVVSVPTGIPVALGEGSAAA
ncbi:DNA cytosine methyltransferase [Streptomyces sp. NPDC051994]|uniref:DNA cytosine methyltransferase n=1 Tax=unclassified Streptomyces TaxID=2593676 RepID=UPI0034331B24